MRTGGLECQAGHLPLFFFLPQVSDILRYLFPVPKDDSRRVITFANQDDYISFRWVSGLGPNGVLTFVSLCCLLLTPKLLPASPHSYPAPLAPGTMCTRRPTTAMWS